MEFEVLKNAIMSVLHIYKGEIVPEASFEKDFGADSLDLYQILVYVEEELGVSLDQSRLGSVKKVADALELITEATGKKIG